MAGVEAGARPKGAPDVPTGVRAFPPGREARGQTMEKSEEKRKVKILIVDDHAVVRAGLGLLIETDPRFMVCGDAANCADAAAAAGRERPDIILLDIDLDGENALTCVPELLKRAPEARVLVLTGTGDQKMHEQALKVGALGLVLKEKAAEVLLKAIAKVNEGEVWFDRTTMGSVLSKMSRGGGRGDENTDEARIATLTEREREVVTLIGLGLRNKQIAERLFVSETTVRHHLTSIFDKLGVTDRLELVIYAYRHNLAKLPK